MPAGILGYAVAMGLVQLLNHVLGHKDNEKSHEQRERFHADQMRHDDRRLRLQEDQGRNAAQAQLRELAHRESLQLAGQSLDHEIKHWPLNIPPQRLQRFAQERPQTPLVLFVPPRLPDAWPSEQARWICENQLREVLAGYSSNDVVRPTMFLGGAWLPGTPRSEAALEALHSCAPTLPIALIQLDYFADGLHILIGCSGFAPSGLRAHPIVSQSIGGSLLEQASHAARDEAARLAPVIEKSRAVDPALLAFERQNRALLGLEYAHEIRLDRQFRLSAAHVLEGVRAFGPALQIAAAGLADFYHWTHGGATPLLPLLLPRIAASFSEDMGKELSRAALEQYHNTYCLYAQQTAGFDGAARLLLLAESLAQPSVRAWVPGVAEQILEAALARYLTARGLPQLELPAFLQRQFVPADSEFLRRLARVLQSGPRARQGRELEIAVDALATCARRRINADA